MRTIVFLSSIVGLSLVACTEPQRGPEVASSSAQPQWAASYADDLRGASRTLSDDRARAHDLDQGLDARAKEVNPPFDSITLQAVVKRADDAGRSEAYVARAHEARQVRAFWDDERDKVVGRAAGAAKGVVGDAKCEGNPDPAGQVAYAVKDSVDRAIERRIRAANDAYVTIDRYKSAIGANNLDAVKKIADDVAYASYLANVALVDDRNRVIDLLQRQKDADATLQHAIADEREFQADKGRADAEKKSSDERVAQYQKADQSIGDSIVAANVSLKNLDDQIKQARADHDAAVQQLVDGFKARQS